MVSRAVFSDSDTSAWRAFGSCSAWPRMSAATMDGSAVSSQMTRISVGPASRSIPTVPKSCRLASATYLLPAPTTMSTGSRPSMP